MVKLYTDPQDVKASSTSVFKPDVNTSTGQGIGELVQASIQAYSLFQGNRDRRAVSNFRTRLLDKQMEDINRQLSESGQPPLTDAEISSMNKTEARLRLRGLMEKQRRDSGSRAYSLAAEERQAIAENPRLAPEISQAFQQTIGMSSGVMMGQVIEDQAGLNIAKFDYETADPNVEHESSLDHEKLVRDWYKKFHPDWREASFENQEKAYQTFNHQQLALANAKNKLAEAKANREDTTAASESYAINQVYPAVWDDVGRMYQSLVTGQDGKPIDFTKYSDEDKLLIHQRINEKMDEAEAILFQALGTGRTSLMNPRVQHLRNFATNVHNLLEGKVEKTIVEDSLDIFRGITRGNFERSDTGQGGTIADLLNQLDLGENLGTTLSALDDSPLTKYLKESASVALLGTAPNVSALAEWGKTLPRSSVFKNAEAFNTAILKTMSNPERMKDPKTVEVLTNMLNNLYVVPQGGDKPLSPEEEVILGSSAMQLYKDPNFVQYSNENPAIGLVIDRTVDMYANRYKEAIAQTTSEIQTRALETTVTTPVMQYYSEERKSWVQATRSDALKDMQMKDLLKVNAGDGLLFWTPKHSTVSQIKNKVLANLNSLGDWNRPGSVLRPKADEVNKAANAAKEKYAEAVARQLLEASKDAANTLNKNYAGPIGAFAKARMQKVPSVKFGQAVNDVLSSKYLFDIPEEEETPSKTQ